MHMFLLLTAAVGGAAGFVLQDGGAMPSVKPREALRARQYVLLSTFRGRRAPPVELMWATSGVGKSDLGVLAEFADKAAGVISLDAAGFEVVASGRSAAAMATFVRRLLDSQNMRVKDEAFMLGVLPYYTGECANLSFDVLTQQLHAATQARSCFPAWVVRKYSKGLHVDRRFMKPHKVRDTERAAALLVRGVMAELGATVQPGNDAQFDEFSTKLLANNRTLVDLQQQLRHKRFREWIEFKKPALKPTSVDKGSFSSWLPYLGTAAPLNEYGYQAVVNTRNDSAMYYFLRRVADSEGLKIVDKGSFVSMVPYYSGLCAQQSYEAFVRELHALVGRNLTMTFDKKGSFNDSPSAKKLQANIAHRAGVDIGQATIENSKMLRIRVSVDNVRKVQETKTWLQAAKILHGQSALASSESLEVESSTPAQCGGGLLLPK